MKRANFSTKIYALIIAFAMVMSSLVTTLSHASGGGIGVNKSLVAICSSLGLQWLDTRTGQVQESGPTSEKSDSSTHCSACITHLSGLPPATNSTIFFDFSDNSAPTRLVVASALTRLPTNQANPRAPPLLA